jgi:hypothetical protein
LPANRVFQNRAGARTHSFFWFSGKIRTLPVCKKQLQTALIVSVTFIWSHPWVGLNGLWYSM